MERNFCVAVTRPVEQSADLVARLQALGADVLVAPTIACAPAADPQLLLAALADRPDLLVLTSASAVAALVATGAPLAGVRVAAVGPATAAAARAAGMVVVAVPPVAQASALPAALGELGGLRILLPQADLADGTLAQALRSQGAEVCTVVAYRTVAGPGVALLREPLRASEVLAITFASGSAARFLVAGLGAEAHTLLAGVALVCIGPATAAVVAHCGLRVAAVAATPDAAGLAAAVGLA